MEDWDKFIAVHGHGTPSHDVLSAIHLNRDDCNVEPMEPSRDLGILFDGFSVPSFPECVALDQTVLIVFMQRDTKCRGAYRVPP